jgi:hypothetical protein
MVCSCSISLNFDPHLEAFGIAVTLYMSPTCFKAQQKPLQVAFKNFDETELCSTHNSIWLRGRFVLFLQK